MCDCHKQLRFEVTTELHERMRRACREGKLSIAGIVAAALTMWLRETSADSRQPTDPLTDSLHPTEVRSDPSKELGTQQDVDTVARAFQTSTDDILNEAGATQELLAPTLGGGK